ncbi:MAG TPA: ribonuclease P protein component [Verrucomicrobiae bacterium]|nr:ribonuclease P protein component [Verrucomicrobiae bacterium]
MINRTHRFHGRASVQRLYKNGKMVRSGSFSLRFTLNPRRDSYRLAIVVSRKVSKSAVVRNRIRRRVYEHVRVMFGSTPIPYDLLITVFDEDVAILQAPELAYEVNKLLKKSKLTTPISNGRAIVEHRN